MRGIVVFLIICMTDKIFSTKEAKSLAALIAVEQQPFLPAGDVADCRPAPTFPLHQGEAAMLIRDGVPPTRTDHIDPFHHPGPLMEVPGVQTPPCSDADIK